MFVDMRAWSCASAVVGATATNPQGQPHQGVIVVVRTNAIRHALPRPARVFCSATQRGYSPTHSRLIVAAGTARSGLAGASTPSLTATATGGWNGPIRGRQAILSRRRLSSWSASVPSGLDRARTPTQDRAGLWPVPLRDERLGRMMAGLAPSVQMILPLRPLGRGGRDHGKASPSVQAELQQPRPAPDPAASGSRDQRGGSPKAAPPPVPAHDLRGSGSRHRSATDDNLRTARPAAHLFAAITRLALRDTSRRCRRPAHPGDQIHRLAAEKSAYTGAASRSSASPSRSWKASRSAEASRQQQERG